ncbi:hypothetical protein MKEN_00779600 [Mycena kentingensis (nom. inval.)]|nr:hypothetical protein MKEN_00779600 [Mycena kentingensis (nom. inval.)]
MAVPNALLKFAIPAGVALALGRASIYDVPGGYRAVMFDRFSGVQDKATSEGTHFLVPWLQRAILYDCRIKPRAGSKDLQMVSITLRVLSRPDVTHLPKIYQSLGLDYDERVLPSIGNEVLKSIVAQFDAAELITQREVVSARIRADLLQRAGEFNLKLEDVSITHLTFGKEFTQAVEAKQIAQQDAERAKFIVEKAEQERQAAVIRAEGEAEAAATISKALERAGEAFVAFRKIEAAKAIVQSLSANGNVSYIPSSSGNVLLQVPSQVSRLRLLCLPLCLYFDGVILRSFESPHFLPLSSSCVLNPPNRSSLLMSLQSMNHMMDPGAAEAPRRAHLYVGNLSPRVTEYMLTEIFAVAGPVQHVKIIPDRNYQHGGLNYGFVEYMDMRAAETALQTLNGRKIFDTEIRVNWAYQGQQNKEDTTGHYHVFVGDLSPEVNDDVLGKAFSAFGTMSDARVMWDMNSGKSRGYGFLAFRDKTDAEQAIATMNGEWLGSRAIRVNWANQKTQGGGGGASSSSMPPMPAARPVGGAGGGMPSPMGAAPSPVNFQGGGGGPMSYEATLAQTPAYNTTVYVGNLVPFCTQADLIPLFQSIGYLSEIRMQADRGFAFVKLDTHEHAAMAIVQLQGQNVHGRPIKCSWGKDRNDGTGGQQMSPATNANPYGNMPMYQMPQATQYGQYGFGAYPGFNQAGTPGSPGMPQPAGGAAGLGLGAAAGPASADPSALAAGQAQWGAADPNSYYSNYWSGYYGQQAGQADSQMQGPP